MKLPFVSRVALDILERAHERERESLREVNAVLRSSLVDVTAKYHQLRLLQHALPPEPPILHPLPPPDPVRAAIVEAAGPDTELARAMSKQAQLDALNGKSADDIVRAIFAGVEQDEGSPI